jgi:hypothetical protein
MITFRPGMIYDAANPVKDVRSAGVYAVASATHLFQAIVPARSVAQSNPLGLCQACLLS